MKKLIKSMFFIIFSYFITSCNENFCDQIIDYSKVEYGNSLNGKTINLKDVFEFKWDTLFIFHPWQHPNEISEVLGFDCNCEIVPEGKWSYIFLLDGKKVRGNVIECMHFTISELHNGRGFLKIPYDNSEFKINFEQDFFTLKLRE